MKTCRGKHGCGESKPENAKHFRVKSGKFYHMCRECEVNYQYTLRPKAEPQKPAVDPYTLIMPLPWPGTGKPFVGGMFGCPA